MQRNTLGLLVAAAAVYGAYRYNKMTPQQKNDLKAKGKSFLEKNLNGLNNLFGKKTSPVSGSNQ
jgi:hypothetical protein